MNNIIMMRYICYAVALCVLSASAQYHFETVRYSNAFLDNGASPRAVAMGEAMAADRGDRTAGLYNPSGILGIMKPSILASHASLFNGLVTYDLGSFIYPVDKGHALSLYFVRSAIEGIWDTRNFPLVNGRPQFSSGALSFTENTDWALGFSYAALAYQVFRYGATFKFIRRQLADKSILGAGVDLGGQYLFKHATVGLIIKDASTTANRYEPGGYEMALPEAYLGWSYKLDLDYLYGTLQFLCQTAGLLGVNGVSGGPMGGWFDIGDPLPQETGLISNPVQTVLGGNLGLEYVVKEKLFFRLGTNSVYQFTAGAGVRINKLFVDYSFQSHADLNNCHRMSLAWDFNGIFGH
ncbi:MAG: hypothetical protein A2268_05450 [Candidatus Raymondbacteria bacterium RifOxyA12_full_50_37]|nr:MAG: hypothetical protein A2268_05450 [Candidatus Raymondbacteria bacterium RifOxyA12_full_50_37]OGJ89010.1 MAG: hypothetical protein A2248_02685 [Candidatus Raymondbacteria bacterium RIFOXYA2_FULL_49_16]OGJ97037.1 MAG: hypothetical protein A2453_04100 [Candidatus Raymondbacteria bacterium RIFOXYC2_FULL_50_21]OGJ97861.1 MAG: hypothetical protein A2487_02210 [Candidatus Raymondbacteria bacterium RifOxyC12_full_50_8]OGK03176.1 MAG: hypothetical protein A2350_15140 [Candidatus Raymondbacteria b